MTLSKRDFISLSIGGTIIGILLACIVPFTSSTPEILLSALNNTWGSGTVNYALWVAMWIVIGEGVIGMYLLVRAGRWARVALLLLCAVIIAWFSIDFYISRGDFGSGGFPLAFSTSYWPDGGNFYFLAYFADVLWWSGIVFFFQLLRGAWARIRGRALFSKQERMIAVAYVLLIIVLIVGMFVPSLQRTYRTFQKEQLLERALQTGDAVLCFNKKLLYEYEQKKCVRAVAIEHKDPNICGLGGPAVGRDNYCIKQVAEAANNPQFCAALDNTEARGEYYYRCYLDFAKSLNNPNICTGIRNIAVQLYPNAQEQCIKDFNKP